MRKCLAAVMLLAASAAHAGPISKFEEKQPEVFASVRPAADVERCLIDMEGLLAPNVYKQADRPDRTTLIWKSPNGISVGRIDVIAVSGGTEVRSWFPAKQVAACAKAAT